uniref:(northern house mosquito) hypothetical protein n=1 Tax=Culex pipiens TaxID=7175 RepID=A0A8D8FPB7_CULPI
MNGEVTRKLLIVQDVHVVVVVLFLLHIHEHDLAVVVRSLATVVAVLLIARYKLLRPKLMRLRRLVGVLSTGSTPWQMLLERRSTEEDVQALVARVDLLPVELLVKSEQTLLLEPTPALLAHKWLQHAVGRVVRHVLLAVLLGAVNVQVGLGGKHMGAGAAPMPRELDDAERLRLLDHFVLGLMQLVHRQLRRQLAIAQGKRIGPAQSGQ